VRKVNVGAPFGGGDSSWREWVEAALREVEFASYEDGFDLSALAGTGLEVDGDSLALDIPVSVAHGGTGQTTAAEAIGELIQALAADSAPDFATDYIGTYDDSADTGKKLLLSLLSSTILSNVRERLTANRTYYVRTGGSDSNTGLADTDGGAFLTIQKAIDVTAALDTSTFNVTIQVRTGAFNAALTLKDPVGSGTVTLQGDTTTPANVTISVAGNCITGTNSFKYTVQGFKLNTSGSAYCIRMSGGFLRLGINAFNGSAFAHIGVFADGYLQHDTDFSIVASAPYHWYAESGGQVACQGRTITLTGTPAFANAFVNAVRGAIVTANANTFSGSGTGPRYYCDDGGTIYTAAAGATYFPGDAAGTGTNYGASPYGRYN
jgi:hypothetical protein